MECKWCKENKDESSFQTVYNTSRVTGEKLISKRHVCMKCMNAKYTKNWIEKNKKRHFDGIYKNMKRHRQLKTDYAIKDSMRPSIKMSQITPEMVALKRLINKLRDEAKECRQGDNK